MALTRHSTRRTFRPPPTQEKTTTLTWYVDISPQMQKASLELLRGVSGGGCSSLASCWGMRGEGEEAVQPHGRATHKFDVYLHVLMDVNGCFVG